jgi:hypothetical protein
MVLRTPVGRFLQQGEFHDMRLASQTLCITVLASIALLLINGCNGASQVNTVLDQQISGALGAITKDYVLIRVVNQTGSDLQLDYKIDGIAQATLSCSAIQEVCDRIVTTCPQSIEATQQRTLDAQGRFVGGRNFNGSDAFSFTGDELSCDSVVLYKFTPTDATAQVI